MTLLNPRLSTIRRIFFPESHDNIGIAWSIAVVFKCKTFWKLWQVILFKHVKVVACRHSICNKKMDLSLYHPSSYAISSFRDITLVFNASTIIFSSPCLDVKAMNMSIGMDCHLITKDNFLRKLFDIVDLIKHVSSKCKWFEVYLPI